MKQYKRNIKIIIADDSPHFIEGLKVLLKVKPDYEIIDIVNNGKELIKSEKLSRADLVLCDIEMPRMNGMEVAKRIGYNYPFIALIALTMYRDKVYLSEMISAGFKGFIYKPDITEKLFDTIEGVLQNRFMFPININF